ncbi:MAG: transporter substrate-binding domain-containing protein [Oscillospiraceae bacterium]|nr:transporter substrate-binding domain-containing protein [Oscillospiraceae bacterium]
MKKLPFIILTVIMLLSLCSCGGVESTVKSLDDIQGKAVGTLRDTAAVNTAAKFSDNVQVYDSAGAMLDDLRSGTLDCAIVSSMSAKEIKSGQRGIKLLGESITGALSYAVAKENADLRDKLNEAIAQREEDKTIESIIKGYADGEGRTYSPQLDPQQTEHKLTLAFRPDCYPYAYTDEEGETVGIDVDITYALCDSLGVGLELVPAQQDNITELVLYGRVSFACGGLTDDGSGSDTVDYTQPYTYMTDSVITRK